MVDLTREPFTLEGWPGVSRAQCEPLRSTGYEHWYQELHCVECILEEGRTRAAFRFYPDLSTGTCTLQEVHVALRAPFEGIPDELEAAATTLLGPSTAATEPEGPESGSGSWRRMRMWSAERHLAYLYDDAYPGDRTDSHPFGSIGFLWRRRPLRAIAGANFDDGLEATDRLGLAIAACHDSGLTDCDRAREALVQRDRDAFVPIFAATLERFHAASTRDRGHAALTYWLDYLARDEYGLLVSGEPGAQARLAESGVIYGEGYDSLVLLSPWLRNLVARDGRSKWGQQAFLKHLRLGLADEDADEDEDEDETGEAFRIVILRGETFLREHPRSAVERDLILELARAHETWWSLSKASPEEEDAEDLARWKEGAEKARQRALELYRRLARQGASEGLKQRIFRLEHDIDTGQRAYDSRMC